MSAPDLPPHRDVARQIDAMALGVDASELHGALCGYLCGGGEAGRGDWLERLALESDTAQAPAEDSALDRLFLASRAQLADPDFGFALLLPDHEREVEPRAEGLLAWCRGFLGGFGLAAGPKPPLSPEAGEALEDLARLAQSRPSYEESDADETALTEIAEFVRVAALLLHGDCVLAPRQASQPPRSLH